MAVLYVPYCSIGRISYLSSVDMRIVRCTWSGVEETCSVGKILI